MKYTELRLDRMQILDRNWLEYKAQTGTRQDSEPRQEVDRIQS
jgi:hypothetical protein